MASILFPSFFARPVGVLLRLWIQLCSSEGDFVSAGSYSGQGHPPDSVFSLLGPAKISGESLKLPAAAFSDHPVSPTDARFGGPSGIQVDLIHRFGLTPSVAPPSSGLSF